MEQDNGEKLLWFMAGATMGAVVALLYAPHPGNHTRKMLGQKIADGRDSLSGNGADLMERGRDLFEKGRRIADDAAEMFERGRKMVQEKV